MEIEWHFGTFVPTVQPKSRSVAFGPSIDSMLSQPSAEGNHLFGGNHLTNTPREASAAPAASS
jgi:hypothetical protein